MKKLSLREAAKLAGRGKSTIANAINDGRLTADRNVSGAYQIDPSELHRVFPLKMNLDTGQFTVLRTSRDSLDTHEAERPSLSSAGSKTATRTRQAERELVEARHAREIAEREIAHLRETLEAERIAKVELAEAHAAHLADLRRELDQMRALIPPPPPAPLTTAPVPASLRRRWWPWGRG